MQKSKLTKKLNIDKLRMILDNPHIKDSSIENETYLNALQKRLTGYSKEKIIKKHERYSDNDNSLKPKVTIHRNIESSIISPMLKTLRSDDSRFIEQKNNLFEDEELFDIEKIDIDLPEFIEVKPLKKESEDGSYIKSDNVETFEEIEDLPEWEAVEEIEDKEIKTFEKPVEKKLKDSEDIPEWESIRAIEVGKEEEKSYSDFEEDKIDEFEEVEKFDELKTISYISDEDAFKDIKSINKKVGKLLFENGITSLEILKEREIKDLSQIKGIRRGLAKKIKEEVDKKYIENGYLQKDDLVIEPESITEEKPSKVKHKKGEGYNHGEYTLYEKEIKLRSDKKQTIHFFSKDKPDDGKPVSLPNDYEVKVNRKTGVPYIRRKK